MQRRARSAAWRCLGAGLLALGAAAGCATIDVQPGQGDAASPRVVLWSVATGMPLGRPLEGGFRLEPPSWLHPRALQGSVALGCAVIRNGRP